MKTRSQAQRDAQLRAMEAARGAAARRADAKRQADRDAADAAAAAAAHEHSFSYVGEYDEDFTSEVGRCKCGETTTRPVKL